MKLIAISKYRDRVDYALLFNADYAYTIDDKGTIRCIKNRDGNIYDCPETSKEDLHRRIGLMEKN